jgi:hypothetical protein
MTDSLTLADARALWWHKQALAGSDPRPLATVLAGSGWLRTLGGTDVYIAARARQPGMTRAALDAAVAAGELRVQPAVRGCIYLVPSSAVPDLLALNAEAWRTQTEKELAKIGKALAVVEAIAPAVLATLTEPRSPDAIRKVFRGDIPSFGDAGKKVGLSSPLPLALRLLEFAGTIERVLDGGRLDSERYLWRKTAGQLAAPARDHVQRVANVLDAFLGFAGPATLAQLSAWSGRAQRDIKAALARLDAVAVDVEGMGQAYLRAADAKARQPAPRGIALLAFEDNYLVNHGLSAVSDPRHHALKVDIWGGDRGPEALGTADHVLSRTIVIDGLVAGFWEVDARSGGAVWYTFDPTSKALARELDERTAEIAGFLVRELGHARSFTLDTMDEVQTRADRIARLAGSKPAAASRTARPPTPAKLPTRTTTSRAKPTKSPARPAKPKARTTTGP